MSKNCSPIQQVESAFAYLIGTKHAIAHCNGTATLHSILTALRVGPGDEVIVPPLTMASTSMAVLHTGATPVYADIDYYSLVIDPLSIRDRITRNTKAIITVSLYGMPPDMDKIMEISREFGLWVVEDNAQAPLAQYKGRTIGTIGHAASYSFQSTKHLSCGEGGMVVTNDDGIAERVRRFSSLGYKDVTEGGKIDKTKIQASDYERHSVVGFNYRMSETQAELLLTQTAQAEALVKLRQKIGLLFHNAIWSTSTKYAEQYTRSYDYTHVYWAFPLISHKGWASAEQFRQRFYQNGGDDIYSAWLPTYQEPAFRRLGIEGKCPVAEMIQPRILALKTNYKTIEKAEEQADIVKKTLREVTWE